jgi:hypothetical protein
MVVFSLAAHFGSRGTISHWRVEALGDIEVLLGLRITSRQMIAE